jgi:hypothetical protein
MLDVASSCVLMASVLIKYKRPFPIKLIGAFLCAVPVGCDAKHGVEKSTMIAFPLLLNYTEHA